MTRILFADADIRFLEEIESLLGTVRAQWDMVFAAGISEAHKTLENSQPFDLVVSDMPLHEGDGPEFMATVKAQSPESVRIVLSGPLDYQRIMTASTFVHQFLSKPIDGNKLRMIISRALSIRGRLRSDDLKRTLLRIGVLPSVPALYQQIQTEMKSPDPSVARIGSILEQDPAMSAKVLQITNSAFVGLANQVSSVVQAAALLGMENIKTFVLLAQAFSAFKRTELPPNFNIDTLWQHSLRVGTYAKIIAQSETRDDEIINHAYSAGLLHDIGLIVLAARLPEELYKAKIIARGSQSTLFIAEKEVLGVTHAEIGGYMLDLWGMPYPVVEAIMFHDLPSSRPDPEYVEAPEGDFSPLTAVHVANYFSQDETRHELDTLNPDMEIDTVHLELLGLTDRLGAWWDICMKVV